MSTKEVNLAPSHSYRDQLASELTRRKSVNQAFSLRAFAKSLEVSPAFLSKVLSGQKDLSATTAYAFAQKLGYNADETAQFCQLVQLCKTADPKVKKALVHGLSRSFSGDEKTTEFHSLDLEAFQVISDWYHYGILELSRCHLNPNQSFDSNLISDRLGITKVDATRALNRLVKLGLLKSSKGRWVKSESFLAVPSGGPNRALKNFHTQMIEKAKVSIELQPVELRDISGITIPISLDKIELAKKEIQAFRRKMAKLLASSRPTEVYQMNVQFFALTDSTGKGGKK